jgi:Protein of unknown function (DUF3703)
MATPTEPETAVSFDPQTFERLVKAYHCLHRRDVVQAWHLLEALHVLGQISLLPHAQTHRLMLGLAWRTRDFAEWVGQLFRLLLVPLGHLLGRLPLGNNGRASVSAFEPMEVPPDLMGTIRQFQSRRP